MAHTSENNSVTLSVNIPRQLAEKLNQACHNDEREKSNYVRNALIQYLEDRLEDAEDYTEALEAHEAFLASGEEAIPWEEVVKTSKVLEKQGR